MAPKRGRRVPAGLIPFAAVLGGAIALGLAGLALGWMVAAVLLVAALVAHLLRNRIRLARLRSFGGHVVIAGDDGLARRVAQAELARGGGVLLWHDGAPTRWMRALDRAGAALVTRTPDDAGTASLALGRARAALLVDDDADANAALARLLVSAAAAERSAGDPLDIILRVDDLEHRRVIERGLEALSSRAARVRFASLPDLAARQLFVAAPLDGFHRHGNEDRLVLLLGFTVPIERYVLRLLAGSHFRDGVRPRFVAIAPDADDHAHDFRTRHPGADTLSPVTFVPADDPAHAVHLDSLGEPVAIVIDAGEDSQTLAFGRAMAARYEGLGIAPPPIHLRLSHASDIPDDATLHVFGCEAQFADPELLLQENHDALARSIHDFYLQGRFDEGERIGARASMLEWEDLPEGFRDDNRLVADCYALKLRDIGARVVVSDGPPMRIEPDELEELSRAEHDRWMGAKLKDGWRFGTTRDDAARLHPDIIPYDALSERIKDLDREQVRAITRLLSVSGRRALRTLTVALAPTLRADPRATLDALAAAMAVHYPDRVPLLAGDLGGGARDLLLAADARDMPVLLVMVGHPAPMLAALGNAERARAARLIQRADTRIAVSDGDAAQVWLAAHADLRLTSEATPADPRDVLVGAKGTIVAAPWTR